MKIVQSTYDIANIFIIIKKSQNLSKNTILFYTSKLRTFLDSKFCPNEITDITPGILRVFFWDYAKTHTPSTVASVHRALKIFFDWYASEIETFDNPITKVKLPHVPPKVIDPVSLDTIKAMLQSPHCNIRSQSLLLFMLDSGARASEILALNVDSVNPISGAVFIAHAKGNKSRTVFISPRTRKVLRKYLQERKVQSEALFTTTTGAPLTYSALNALLKRLAKRAGVRPPTPHDFRRAFALNMLRSGTDLLTLATIMGHSNLATLKQYVKLTTDDTMLAHRRAGGVDKWLKG
jgi:site-specific recombinase XerD